MKFPTVKFVANPSWVTHDTLTIEAAFVMVESSSTITNPVEHRSPISPQF